MLGSAAPRTYLVAFQNSAELRATGGFISAIGLLTVFLPNIEKRRA